MFSCLMLGVDRRAASRIGRASFWDSVQNLRSVNFNETSKTGKTMAQKKKP